MPSLITYVQRSANLYGDRSSDIHIWTLCIEITHGWLEIQFDTASPWPHKALGRREIFVLTSAQRMASKSITQRGVTDRFMAGTHRRTASVTFPLAQWCYSRTRLDFVRVCFYIHQNWSSEFQVIASHLEVPFNGEKLTFIWCYSLRAKEGYVYPYCLMAHAMIGI
jgi:hypothetical protein